MTSISEELFYRVHPIIAIEESVALSNTPQSITIADFVGDTNDALSSIDWDFSDAPASKGLHAIHPYPAKFISQIPRKLIELFHPGDFSVILDPFCGSGTTLAEAIDLGLNAYGIDVHPIACLTAQ